MLSCLGYRDYFGEFECGYGASISCDDCVINGGNYSPQTDKLFRGNLEKYKKANEEYWKQKVQESISNIKVDVLKKWSINE